MLLTKEARSNLNPTKINIALGERRFDLARVPVLMINETYNKSFKSCHQESYAGLFNFNPTTTPLMKDWAK